MPSASCSACAHPVPSPSSSRPSVSRSTVAARLASSAGWWSALLITSGPTRRVVVTSAALDQRAEGVGAPVVVGGLQGGVPEALGLAGDVLPFRSRAAREGLQREPERPHGAFSPASTGTSRRLPGGASGQLQRGSNAHDGE